MGLIPSISDIFAEDKIIDVDEVSQRHWLEESRKWLENVDQIHLVLASGKLVQHKNTFRPRLIGTQ